MKLTALVLLAIPAFSQTLPISVPLLDFANSVQTRPFAVVASIGALQATNCVPDSYAVVTGGALYRNSATGTCVWTPTGANSVGSANAIQSANGSGGLLDIGCTGATGSVTCPNGFSSGGPFQATGLHQTIPTAPSANSNTLYFDSVTNHTMREDASANAFDLEPTHRIAAYNFDGGGSALSGTLDACVDVPAPAAITGVTLLSDVTGSATVDVRTVAYSSYTGPGSASSITAAAIPALATATKYQDTTLTGWTKAVPSNTVMCFHGSGFASATWVMVDVKGTN